jgi:hypothetical protein
MEHASITAPPPSTADAPPLTPGEVIVVDALQDEVMASSSVDGRPPTHTQRNGVWLWGAAAMTMLVCAALAIAITMGARPSIIAGVAIFSALAIIMGGWPILIAGKSRGREEADARIVAMAKLHPSDHRI